MFLSLFTKKKLPVFYPALCHATFHHALITCCNVSRTGYIAHDRDTFDFSQGHVTENRPMAVPV